MTGNGSPSSRYARLSPTAARVILLVVCALALYGAGAQSKGLGDVTRSPDQPSDLEMYEAIVDRVSGGGWYYDVAGDELRTRGYATRPSPNWRFPTTAWVVASLGTSLAVVVVRALAFAAIAAWVIALRREGVARSYQFAVALLLFGAVSITAARQPVVLHEVWAGILIALSLALRPRSWVASVLVALLAVAFRELALAYLVVMGVMALVERHRREAAAWAAAVAVFLVGLAVHTAVVTRLMTDTDRTNSWLALGGWPFVVDTAQWNLFALLVGATAVAVVVPFAVLGAGSWDHPLGTRLGATVVVYVVIFLVLGRPDNSYWGIVFAPLLAVSLVFAPSALRALVQASKVSGPNGSSRRVGSRS